jgi:hypothetical protein
MSDSRIVKTGLAKMHSADSPMSRRFLSPDGPPPSVEVALLAKVPGNPLKSIYKFHGYGYNDHLIFIFVRNRMPLI